MKKPRIGLLTGGGDAPGLNGVIESCVKTLKNNWEVVGICDGFEGVFQENTKILNDEKLIGLHAEAGTLLGTSNRSRVEGREEEFVRHFKNLKLEGLIAVGGDGTFTGLKRVSKDIRIIGVPKTIDNDLQGTEITFGFDTACSVVSESVDSLRATAEAHRRVIIIEAMGRTAGWIALGGGMASYADVILVPERPFQRKALRDFLVQEKNKGRRGLIIVAAEGAMAEGEKPQVAFHVKESPQAERFGGVAQSLARWIEAEIGWESRHVVLGHLQRSRPPTTTDRFLTLAMGVEVSQIVKDGLWDHAVVYRQGQVQRAPIQDLMQPPRLIDPGHRWIRMAQAVGIFV